LPTGKAQCTRQYLIYSDGDFEAFGHAGAISCTDRGEIWHGVADCSAAGVKAWAPKTENFMEF